MNDNRVLCAKLLASALLMLGLPGCATMNQAECTTVDWRTVGYEDGVAGYSGDRIGLYRKSCAKYGVAPDLNAYQTGRDQGLREYCQPETGYQLGLRGGAYNSSCPSDVREPFESAYHAGFELYTMRARVASATNELEASHREIAQIDQNLVANSVLILTPTTENAVRAQALLDAKNMVQRQEQLKARIPQLEQERAEYQRDLDNYMASNNGNR